MAKEKKEDKKGLEDLIRYELPALANLKQKGEPEVALEAMRGFYISLGLGDDPILGDSFRDALEGLSLTSQQGNPSITNTGLVKAMMLYGSKFENAFVTSKINDLYEFVKDSCNIPSYAKKGILEYKDKSISDLVKEIKDDKISEEIKENYKKAIEALNKLKELRLNESYFAMKKEGVEAYLTQIYKPKEKEK